MEFFKNFYKEDDKVIGLCSLKKKDRVSHGFKFEQSFSATKLLYEPKLKTNFFMV